MMLRSTLHDSIAFTGSWERYCISIILFTISRYNIYMTMTTLTCCCNAFCSLIQWIDDTVDIVEEQILAR